MSKWFSVEITQVTMIAVEVEDDEDEDEAIDAAVSEISLTGDIVDTAAIEVQGELLDTSKRHAHIVATL